MIEKLFVTNSCSLGINDLIAFFIFMKEYVVVSAFLFFFLNLSHREIRNYRESCPSNPESKAESNL